MSKFNNKIVLVVCLWSLIEQINSSAIPMWEFLSKQEKTSYLYSMFANQVEEFCEKATIPNCNQELLKYGLNKLKLMPEDHLDVMDPYQRGANNIIWNSMMEGHEMMKTTPEPQKLTTTTTTATKPNSYEDESFNSEFGAQGEASAKIENVYRLPPPKGFVYTVGRPQYTYPNNYQYHPVKINGDSAYTKFQQQYIAPPRTTTQRSSNYENLPLTGPMVVKVYPDGTPVREPQQPLPQDEDLRQYQLSKIKIPNF